MKIREIPLNLLTPVRGTPTESTEGYTAFLCPPEGLSLCGSGPAGAPLGGIGWEGMNYLTIEAECPGDCSAAFELYLWEQGSESGMRILFGILPGLMTPVPISLNILESQDIFPERTMGRLKMSVFGKPVDRRRVDRIFLATTPGLHEQEVRIRKIFLSDEMPKIDFPRRPMMDELGQRMAGNWPGKVRSRQECTRALQRLLREAEAPERDPDLDSYGGWKGKNFEKTGWFHVCRDGRRWWLADPEGNAFLSTGIDCVRPGSETRIDPMEPFFSKLPPEDEKHFACRESPAGIPLVNFGVFNLIEAFGPDSWWESWAKITKAYLIRHGFNTIGNWSQKEFIDYAGMPYVLPLDTYSPVGFPETERKVFRDFPDVFSPEFEHGSELFASALKPFAEDRNMIGYFLRNEPAWAFVEDLNLAEEMLANPAELASKHEFIRFLREKYRTVPTLNEKWNLKLSDFNDLLKPLRKACSLSRAAREDLTAFSERMIARYVELPSRKCREKDQNHLNLGMRYAYITGENMLAGCRCFDVFSMNSYQISPLAEMERIGRLLDMPVMIGEFHHGAPDRGLTATGIRAVKNQEERGTAYRYYIEQGARSPYFLGAHYFMLNDQSCLGRFDGENYQIGLMDVCMREYKEISRAAGQCHRELYPVADGKQKPFSRRPAEIPAVHY